MSVIEMTTFQVRPDQVSAMLAARPGMLAAFRRDRRGFVSARLVRTSGDNWLDFVEWTDDAAWDESRAKGANQPEIAAFFATIDAVVSAERGARYDDAADGRRSVRTVAYGPHPSQVGELYLPEGEGPFPVVVLIHGGYWSAMFDRRQTTGLADDLVAHGFAVWNVQYRRIGEPGGGWPGTFLDVAAAVDALRGIDPAVDDNRVVVVGHSAGGQLAAWTAHRSVLPAGAPGANPRVTPVGVASLAGVLDLVAADAVGFGSVLADPDAEPTAGAPDPSNPVAWPTVGAQAKDGITRVLLGGTASDVPERYALASPTALPPTELPVLVVHGTADDAVAPTYSRAYADAQAARGQDVRLVEVEGVGHFGVIDPAGLSWRLTREWIEDLLGHGADQRPAASPSQG
ncbi:alpha/beta hydrolase fold domain-containing protein [Streptomyces sp. NPDC026672]|uniref:alpha/beta hydrolase n=1 Tax=unclassified Streptomyces TaxID=2593676 RepID=UPI0033CC0382